MITFHDHEKRNGQRPFPFHYKVLAGRLLKETLDQLGLPLSVQVDIHLVSGDQIRSLNKDHRGIDSVTDVLSFPNLDIEKPGKIAKSAIRDPGSIDPETGLMILGEVILCTERVLAQAKEYGHSVKREYAFLLVHSFLHLIGFDHIKTADEAQMKKQQEAILNALQLGRNDS